MRQSGSDLGLFIICCNGDDAWKRPVETTFWVHLLLQNSALYLEGVLQVQ